VTIVEVGEREINTAMSQRGGGGLAGTEREKASSLMFEGGSDATEAIALAVSQSLSNTAAAQMNAGKAKAATTGKYVCLTD
jgi:hypothetical protein